MVSAIFVNKKIIFIGILLNCLIACPCSNACTGSQFDRVSQSYVQVAALKISGNYNTMLAVSLGCAMLGTLVGVAVVYKRFFPKKKLLCDGRVPNLNNISYVQLDLPKTVGTGDSAKPDFRPIFYKEGQLNQDASYKLPSKINQNHVKTSQIIPDTISKRVIYIYTGNGAQKESFCYLCQLLNGIVDLNYYEIKSINSDEILQQNWTSCCDLLIMPGGADLGYCAALNGKGNNIIKDFVNSGGAYLGICAGAYYAASVVRFDERGKNDVCGSRELKFTKADAVGPLVPYDYLSFSGARACPIRINVNEEQVSDITVFYNGGPYFSFPCEILPSNEKVLAWYVCDITPTNQKALEDQMYGYYSQGEDESLSQKLLPAIVKIKQGNGVVILSGVHLEYSPQTLDPTDRYLNSIVPVLADESVNSARINLAKRLLQDLHIKVV